MKSARFAAFALSVLCCSSILYPQQPPASQPSKNYPTHGAKVATQAIPVIPVSGLPVTEEELRQALIGKNFYLRGLWMNDSLHFDMNGKLESQSRKGPFTLCAVEIEKVHLDKKHVELIGVRYGIHFEDDGDWAGQAEAFDRIPITPKKKHLDIVIERQQVVIPKKKKHGKAHPKPAAVAAKSAQNGRTTKNPAEVAERLRRSINRIFAPSLDPAMVAQMPHFWQYFYNAQRKHQSIEPSDPNIVHPGPGIVGPTIVRNQVPASNEYAQKSQVAGVASYEVILGADGKPLGVAVVRPIGFGLDENAVAAIRKSTFRPAIKAGKAVPSVFDLLVSFRIYSKLTEGNGAGIPSAPRGISPITGKRSLPGPYSADSAPR